MVFPVRGTGMFQVTCADDEVLLANSHTVNINPPPKLIPAVGVSITGVPRPDLGGNIGFYSHDTGIKVTVFDTNHFFKDTTITVSIECIKTP